VAVVLDGDCPRLQLSRVTVVLDGRCLGGSCAMAIVPMEDIYVAVVLEPNSLSLLVRSFKTIAYNTPDISA